MQRIERGQIAFPRHAESVRHAVNGQLVDENLAASAGAVVRAHSCKAPERSVKFDIGRQL